MAGAGEAKRLRLFVRPPAAARTPDFIEVRFEIYLAPGKQRFLDTRRITTADPHFSRMLPVARRPIDNYTRTSYAAESRRVLSCAARLVPRRRDTDSSSLQKPVLSFVAFLLLRRTRFCDVSVAASDGEVSAFLKPDR